MERADGRSNLDQLQSNIASYLGTDSSQEDTEEQQKIYYSRSESYRWPG